MTVTPAIDPETGALTISRSAWRILLRAAGVEAEEPAAGDERAAAGLAREGVLVDGELDARVAPVLRTAARSDARLSLFGGGTQVEGWLSEHGVTLAIPDAAESLTVIWVPLALLADAVARLLGLSPRQQGAAPARMAASDLALALAGTSQRGEGPLGAILDHWLVEISPNAPADGPAQRIEVVDTDRGLLSVESEGGSVDLSPVSPSEVWRRLTTLSVPPVT